MEKKGSSTGARDASFRCCRRCSYTGDGTTPDGASQPCPVAAADITATISSAVMMTATARGEHSYMHTDEFLTHCRNKYTVLISAPAEEKQQRNQSQPVKRLHYT